MSAPSAPPKSEGGNTITPSSRVINEAKKWCFTWNNYTDDYESVLGSVCNGPLIDKWIWGLEVAPSTGMLHVQGFIEAKKKLRPSVLGLPKQIHWEKCKGTAAQNIEYCSKEGNFKTNQNIPVPLVKMTRDQLYPWQARITDLIEQPEDPLFGRTIYWFWEPTGAVGKSVLCTYLVDQTKTFVVSGKATDMKCGVAGYLKETGEGPHTIIVDIPRSVEQRFVSFTGIEEIKNGLFFSPKFDSSMCRFNRPHVVCFSNEPPDLTMCSQDRWIVHDLRTWIAQYPPEG